ncbi:carcinoembryonic antigen-related cell adhesion molecule 8-like isoform X2 [Xenopus tropicalis]|nr:carcinoembryonic antigen-related cell adhesion molecule 8-like isoform X2 [Xenopus tropicalis]
MDGAHGIGVQLIPQYPVVSQSVTLSVTGVTGTIRQFDWYKGSSTNTNTQIFTVIPSTNSVTKGPQYFPRASQFPNGSLQISGLFLTDQGSYTVQIQTESTVQATVSLPVYGPVTASGISTDNKEPQENQPVTLTCSANNAEQILWGKNGVPLPPGLTLSADNRTLTFPRISRSDTGQYRCEASNAVSKIISDPYTLTVNYGPEYFKITGTLQVTSGYSTSLECSADSVPAPTYQWKFNGTNLESQTNPLYIQQATPENAGNYTCIGTNSVTKLSRETSVYVSVNDYDASHSGNSAAITVAIICGSILGIVLISGIMALLYRKYVLPLRGQSGDRGEDPSQIYYNIPNTAAAHPAIEEGPYMGLQYPSQDTYSELKP